jgi:hypothetical protein
MNVSEVPADRQTHYAGAFLTGEAKIWFRKDFPDTHNLPALDDFLDEFKEQFLASHDDDDVLQRLETIQQGDWPLAQYTTEVDLLILQLGSKDPRLEKRHYLWGLNQKIGGGMIAALTGKEMLKDLIKLANVVARNLELAKSLDESTSPGQSSRSSATKPRSSTPAGPSTTTVNRETDSSGKFLKRLTEAEKRYLRNNDGCFNC